LPKLFGGEQVEELLALIFISGRCQQYPEMFDVLLAYEFEDLALLNGVHPQPPEMEALEVLRLKRCAHALAKSARYPTYG
jgi:hypothetical protein